MTEDNKRINPSRVMFACIYFLLAAGIIVLWDDRIFYLHPNSYSYNIPRLLWCGACSFGDTFVSRVGL